MMVVLFGSVECSAKIAMTTLLFAFAAMGLLSDRDLSRSILLEDCVETFLMISKRAEELCFVTDADSEHKA
jgi:hypothetical protein